MSRAWTNLRFEWRILHRDRLIILPLVTLPISSSWAAHLGLAR